MHPLVVSDTYIYEGVGNCLLVENGGRYHVLLAHMECLGEMGWKRRCLAPTDVELMLFAPCMQTREQSHAVTSLWYASFGF